MINLSLNEVEGRQRNHSIRKSSKVLLDWRELISELLELKMVFFNDGSFLCWVLFYLDYAHIFV